VWFAPWFRVTYKELSVNLWKCVGANDVTFQVRFMSPFSMGLLERVVTVTA